MIVFFTVFPAQNSGLQKARETLNIEKLVTKPRVEALAVTVLPGRTRFDEEGLETLLRDPVLDGIGHELRPVVRT